MIFKSARGYAPIISAILLLVPPTALARSVTGIVFGEREITIKAKSQGEIMALNFPEGERVSTGAVLAVIDDRQEQIEASQAKIEWEAAEQDFHKTESIRKYVSKDEIAQKKNASLLKKAAYELKEYHLSNTRVSSPIDGIVTKKYFDLGETVSVGDKLFEVVQLENLVIEMNVPADAVSEIKKGTKLGFKVDGIKDRQFEGEVSFVSPVLDAASGTIKVRMGVKNPVMADKGYELRPGVIATVEISKEEPQGQLPERASKN